MVDDEQALGRVLEGSQRLGFLGPGPVADHVAHAERFAAWVGGAPWVLELGSGGGVPGLVLAAHGLGERWSLVERSSRRAAFLRWAVGVLGLGTRVEVLGADAAEVSRRAGYRGAVAVVVSRSFAPPAVVAEIGGAFVAAGGRLVVAEPPGTPCGAGAGQGGSAWASRWPAGPLSTLGLRVVEVSGGVAVLERVGPLLSGCPRARVVRRGLWAPEAPGPAGRGARVGGTGPGAASSGSIAAGGPDAG